MQTKEVNWERQEWCTAERKQDSIRGERLKKIHSIFPEGGGMHTGGASERKCRLTCG